MVAPLRHGEVPQGQWLTLDGSCACTTRDLTGEVLSGHFREDLYFSLNVFPIALTPLRERVEDFPLLATHFLSLARALAMVIDGQSALPMAQFWGAGQTASSDGQFFPMTHQRAAMNLINAKYGREPRLKPYTHVSDQFGAFATQTIPATVNEAPYILDGLLMTSAG